MVTALKQIDGVKSADTVTGSYDVITIADAMGILLLSRPKKDKGNSLRVDMGNPG